MKVIIPTYRRVGTQNTFKQLPEEWKRRTLFVTDQQDADHMRSFLSFKDREFAIVPPSVTTIAQKRKWIIENIECDSMVQLDDDLIFATRNPDKPGLIKPTEAQVDYWFKELEKMLKQYAHAGFSARQFNNNREPGWIKNTRMMYSLGYQPKVLLKECELGRIETREDMDVTLQLLKKGYENVVCSDFCHDQVFNAVGGCSLQRTIEKSNEDADRLAELHPGIVRVVEKAYKTSIPRKEVTCAWKKACTDSQKQESL